MFLDNEHTARYLRICEEARSRELKDYYENHPAVPLYFGGKNDEENNVKLTPEEHYEVHELLTKMTEGEAKKHMIFMLSRLQHDCPFAANRGIKSNTPQEYASIQREKNTQLSDWRTFDNEMDKYRPIEQARQFGGPVKKKIYKPVNGKLKLKD